MILCLDVGNSHLYGGVFLNQEIQLRFRYSTAYTSTSDQLGVFLKNVLQENSINPAEIKQIAICSVAPQLDYSLKAACRKYFQLDPFILQVGVKTGLKIQYRNPAEVGADRIANSIAAVERYPNKNILIIDLGTATTFCAVSANKEYRGGAIMPGMRLSMETLQNNTAKLSSVEIITTDFLIGRSTTESIQSGLYNGHLGVMREFIQRCRSQCFNNESSIVIGTGGFAYLFEKENIFHEIFPDLVLEGLLICLLQNINENTKAYAKFIKA